MGYDLALFEDGEIDEELVCPICKGRVANRKLINIYNNINISKVLSRLHLRYNISEFVCVGILFVRFQRTKSIHRGCPDRGQPDTGHSKFHWRSTRSNFLPRIRASPTRACKLKPFVARFSAYRACKIKPIFECFGAHQGPLSKRLSKIIQQGGLIFTH